MDVDAANFMPPAYEDVVAGFGIDLAGCPADRPNGDRPDNEDDPAREALYRLVQAWRLNAPHLRFLLEMMVAMQGRKRALDRDIRSMDRAARHAVADECKAVAYGAATYAGCVVLLLSGLLLRFKDDLGVGWSDWNRMGPLYHGHSFGQVIAAAANGFRHDDEWAQARAAKPQQQATQQLLATVLGVQDQGGQDPGRCPEVLDLLGAAHGFAGLAGNFFAFAGKVAARAQAMPRR